MTRAIPHTPLANLSGTLPASYLDDINTALGLGANLGQVVGNQTGAVATGTTVIPFDDTIPQVGEGDQYLSQTITPLNAGSTLYIEILLNLSSSAATQQLIVAVFRDGAADAVAAADVYQDTATAVTQVVLKFSVAATAVVATTFTVRAGGNGVGTTTVNGQGAARRFGGALLSSIKIVEVLPAFA